MVISALYVAGANSLGRTFARVTSFVALAGAAFRCAAAVESGYRPEDRDLAALGIGDIMQRGQYIGR